jgi:hypothetical protein
MTREHAKELLPIITAFANGEDVQGFEALCNEWITLPRPTFNDCPKAYRIAPKPRKVWVNEYPQGLALHCFPTRSEADLSDYNKTRIACYELELPPLS